MAEKLYFHQLTDRDRIAISITTGHAGAVQHYSVQFECRLTDSDEWTPVRRYDCSHNVVHTHAFSASRANDQRSEQPELSFKAGLQLAVGDLDLNWERYRWEYGES